MIAAKGPTKGSILLREQSTFHLATKSVMCLHQSGRLRWAYMAPVGWQAKSDRGWRSLVA